MDQTYGLVGFSAAVAIYVYYTVWVVLTPFIDEEAAGWFHNLFPDRWCGIERDSALCAAALCAAPCHCLHHVYMAALCALLMCQASSLVSHRWALAVPTALFVAGLTLLLAYIGIVSLRGSR